MMTPTAVGYALPAAAQEGGDRMLVLDCHCHTMGGAAQAPPQPEAHKRGAEQRAIALCRGNGRKRGGLYRQATPNRLQPHEMPKWLKPTRMRTLYGPKMR